MLDFTIIKQGIVPNGTGTCGSLDLLAYYLPDFISLKQKNSEYDLTPESQFYLLNVPTLSPKFKKSKFGFK